MSEAELKAENAHLKAEHARLTAERDRLAREYATAQAEQRELMAEQRDRRHNNKKLAEELAALTAERDEYKTRAEMTGADWQARIAEQDKMIRTLKHQTAYAKVAKALRVSHPGKLADLIMIAGYQPETDEPDEAKITAAFVETLKARPYLQDAPAPTPAAPAGSNGYGHTSYTAGPGSDRGVSITEGGAKPTNRISGRL